jgi:hypothetical protein
MDPCVIGKQRKAKEEKKKKKRKCGKIRNVNDIDLVTKIYM